MTWYDKFILKQAERVYARKKQSEEMNTAKSYIGPGASLTLDKGAPEGEDTIRFELSTAIGGKILTVRRYERRTDRNDTATYVIPNGEDLSERMVKILNLEMFK